MEDRKTAEPLLIRIGKRNYDLKTWKLDPREKELELQIQKL